MLPGPANAVAAAPLEVEKALLSALKSLTPNIPQSRYAQLVAVGCEDGNVSFVDLSFTSQQPLFRESKMVRVFLLALSNFSTLTNPPLAYSLLDHRKRPTSRTLS